MTYYYFDFIMKARNIDSGNILLDEKVYKSNLVHGISYKTFMNSKSLRIWFDKIDGFIKIYDGIRHLVILGHSCFDEICDSIKGQKSGITDSINYNLERSRTDSHNSLPIEKYRLFILL